RATADRVYLTCADRFPTSSEYTAHCNDAGSRGARLLDFSGGEIHNSFLGLSMQLGIPATVGWVLVFIAVLGIATRSVRRGGGVRIAAAAALIGGLIIA